MNFNLKLLKESKDNLVEFFTEVEFDRILRKSKGKDSMDTKLYIGTCVPKNYSDSNMKILNYMNRNSKVLCLATSNLEEATEASFNLDKKEGYCYVVFSVKFEYYLQVNQTCNYIIVMPTFTEVVKKENYEYRNHIIVKHDMKSIFKEALVDFDFLRHIDSSIDDKDLNALYNKWKESPMFPHKLPVNIKNLFFNSNRIKTFN